MAVRFHFKTLVLTGILLGACGEDAPADENDDEQEQEESATADKKDSGAKADGGAKADAGKKDEDEDEDQDEDQDSKVDAGAPSSGTDAGSKTDAGGSKPDAGGTQTDAGGTKADAGAGGSSCADLTYDTFGSDFIEMYCISCHSGQKPTLNDLASIVTNKAKIKAEAVTSKAMPMKGAPQPTDDERKKLGQWLDCGPK